MALVLFAIVAGCYKSHLPAEDDAGSESATDVAVVDAAVVDVAVVDVAPSDVPLDIPRDMGLPDTPAPEMDSGPITPPGVEQLCRESPQEFFALAGGFPPLSPGCPWNEGDNIAPTDRVAAARVVEEFSLGIDQGSVLCDLEIQVGGPSSLLLYDDNFFLVLGDVVLAASDRDMVANLAREGRLRLWDWSRVVGRPMAVSGNVPYCAGEAEGLSECEIPVSEERGTASIRFSDAFVAEVAAVLAAGPPLVLRLITIGDNDAPQDCSHDAIEFRITGSGVAP